MVMIEAWYRRMMSDFLPDTESVPLNTWCPECGGPVKDERAAMAYCIMHQPQLNTGHVGFHGEAGGVSNTAICDFIHRRKETSTNV